MTALLIALLLAADAPLLVGPDVLLDVPIETRETSVGQFKSDRQYKVSTGRSHSLLRGSRPQHLSLRPPPRK